MYCEILPLWVIAEVWLFPEGKKEVNSQDQIEKNVMNVIVFLTD